MRGLSRPQAVAHTADGVDQWWVAGVIELLAQIADVRRDDLTVAAEVVIPDVVEDLCTGHHASAVDQQVPQQPELSRRQLDLFVAVPNLVGFDVHDDVLERDAACSVDRAQRTAEHRLDSEPKLFKAERLGDVVVAASREAGPNTLRVVASGEEYDGNVIPVTPEATADLEPIEVWQVDVEHHEVGRSGANGVKRFVTRTRDLDV